MDGGGEIRGLKIMDSVMGKGTRLSYVTVEERQVTGRRYCPKRDVR
jgi:hypothetical protein